MCQGYGQNWVITRAQIQALNSHRFVTKTDRPLRAEASVLHTVHELNGVLLRFLSISALFALDIRICHTYIPEKLSMCDYMTERDRKGDTAHV